MKVSTSRRSLAKNTSFLVVVAAGICPSAASAQGNDVSGTRAEAVRLSSGFNSASISVSIRGVSSASCQPSVALATDAFRWRVGQRSTHYDMGMYL